ncbi:MAG: hypothetical protein HND55_13475 [Pseudomonadota bacterium]|nr:MAG: hypothetical protein HND55_13475 [Pseudomonadota bacterium]
MTDQRLTYAMVNREERFFCMLLSHCLLANDGARQGFAKVVEENQEIPSLFSASPDLALYVEVAALRDFWRHLGNPNSKNPDVEEKRLRFLRKAVDWANTLDLGGAKGCALIPFELLEKSPGSPLWTEGGKSSHEPKLWSPARWSMKGLDEFPLSKPCAKRLMRLRWAFNAKPDILVLEGRRGLLIEAKVESGGGSNRDGYDQVQTQRDILSLWKHLELPGLDGTIHLVTLGKGRPLNKEAPHLTWQSVLEGIGKENMDQFTWECFRDSEALGVDL